MLLELKNIKVNERFSEETTQFMADIFVNGKKVGYAKNDGQGGSTYYHSYGDNRVQLAAAEAYCLVQPPLEMPMGQGGYLEIPSNLENWIDTEVEKFLYAKDSLKFQKKIQKACETGIVWGVPNTDKVSVWDITKPKRSISVLMQTPQGKAAVMNIVVKVRAQLEKGEVIFNTNVPHSL